MTSPVWSASLMCAPLGRLEETITALEAAGCHELHFDVMDGLFVPNFTLGSDFVSMAKSICSMQCDAHLMITNPDDYIESFVEAGCDTISVHLETCTHIHRTLDHIRDAGASPGVAINPATPLTKLEYLLPKVDRVLLMTVDPGYAGQKMIPSAYERVRILRQNLDYANGAATIQVDGNINVRNAALLMNAGASNFVLGTSSIFKGGDVGTALPAFALAVDEAGHTI